MPTNPPATVNRCGYCGASSYHRVVARDEAGAMRYTSTLQCTGCGRDFTDLLDWRQGGLAAGRTGGTIHCCGRIAVPEPER